MNRTKIILITHTGPWKGQLDNPLISIKAMGEFVALWSVRILQNIQGRKSDGSIRGPAECANFPIMYRATKAMGQFLALRSVQILHNIQGHKSDESIRGPVEYANFA